MGLRIILMLVLSSFEVVAEIKPDTKEVRSPNDPQMDQKAVYVANNTKFERKCVINGGRDGLPVLEFKDDEGMVIQSNPPRLNIRTEKDTVKNVTTGTFLLDPAYVDDNKLKRVTCRNKVAGRSTAFKLKVIPDKSIPSVKINKDGKSLKIKRDSTAKLTCSLTAKTSDVVKRYSIAWSVADKEKATCSSKKEKVLPVNTNAAPIVQDGDVFTSELTIIKANRSHNQRFFCVACMEFQSSRFDTVRIYHDFIDVMVSGDASTKEEIMSTVGDNVGFDCEGVGKPYPKLTWWRKEWNKDEVSLPFDYIDDVDKRYTYGRSGGSEEEKQMSAENSVLKIAGVAIADRSQYICRAQFVDGNVTKLFTLRVRDPKGVWWPVCGMLAEAVLLFFIIVLCDTYKQKKKRKGGKDGVWPDGGACPSTQPEEEPLVNSASAKVTSNNEVST